VPMDTLRSFRTTIYRDVNALLGAKSRPVFILGCGRSGTSMLLARLARSWRVEAFNEDRSEAFVNFRLKDLKAIKGLIESSRASLVIFKPILNTHQSRELLDSFPDAKIVFVYRQFDDVINSSLKKFGLDNRISHVHSWVKNAFEEFANQPPPQDTQDYVRSIWRQDLSVEEGAAIYWLFYNRLYFDLGLYDHPRVRLAQYERLVVEPEVEFMALAGFLGMPFRASMVKGIKTSSIGRDPTPALTHGLRDECEHLMDRLYRSQLPK